MTLNVAIYVHLLRKKKGGGGGGCSLTHEHLL